MKKHLLKNITKCACVFSISILCAGIFSQKAFGFKLDTAFSDSRRSVYNSMSNQGKQELSDFYEVLETSVRQRHHNNHANTDFKNFLKQVDAFLNTPNDREKKAYILGIFPLEGGYYIINTRHLNFFTSKCKSSINASFQMLGFNTVSFNNISRREVQNFLNSFNKVNCDARKRWTCRIRSKAVNNFVQNPALTNIPNIIQQPERSNNDSTTITNNVSEDNVPTEFSFDNAFANLPFEDDNFSNWF